MKLPHRLVQYVQEAEHHLHLLDVRLRQQRFEGFWGAFVVREVMPYLAVHRRLDLAPRIDLLTEPADVRGGDVAFFLRRTRQPVREQ